ncbi:Predicted membrane protein [Leifsonia sp. 98AMF]|uniref:DUF2142 domain-containing protein n=1 Tax=Leifsonia sp. 467MF TaxID=1798220 RepID=UPI00087D7C10|nr:DUF2142 domain-containing protein [Leifsonia sp. 467MF]SDH18881.1 Predicted membrane protein [Leifsonia sp. 197AMF]SDJ19702.1 Predicted membrane protein [Leifsonia sp. 466MF]SDJ46368.1 Predicted membrane protein [Leifsonia sp. 157MF]SDN41106.1 Predicted membrane protein [Leifsonia sp. 509MF]SFM52823.1 Predicted membrane protein [Leifsonia sp. 98AMF]
MTVLQRRAGGTDETDLVTDRQEPAARTRLPVRAFLVSWALLSLLCICWSFATPISGSPDEPAHIVRAASVVRGEWVGTPSPVGNVVTVPAYIARSQAVTCFAFHPAVDADCGIQEPADPDADTRSTTSAGLYNPLYYLAVGWPTLVVHDTGGIYAMRAVSALLTALFLALAFAVTTTLPHRRLAMLSYALAITPMMLFLGGTVNPNSLEAAATLAVFVAMLAIAFDRTAAGLRSNLWVVGAGIAVAVNARGLSPLWLVVALGVPLVLIPGPRLLALLRRPATIVTMAVSALFVIGALAWTLGSNSLANAIVKPDEALQFPGVGASPLTGFLRVLTGTVGYGQGLVGLFGWLDTPAPDVVVYLYGAGIAALVVAALLVLRGRRLLAFAILLAAFLLLPAIVQAAYIHGGGLIWQGRYNLPLFLCLIVGAAAFLGPRVELVAPTTMRRLILLVSVLAVGAQWWAFEATLRRYAVGGNGTLRLFLLGDAPWSPPGGNLLWLILSAVLIAASGVLLAVATWPRREAEVAVAPAVR